MPRGTFTGGLGKSSRSASRLRSTPQWTPDTRAVAMLLMLLVVSHVLPSSLFITHRHIIAINYL